VDNTKLLATNNVLLSTVFLCLRRTFLDTQALAQGGEWTSQCSEKITKDLTRYETSINLFQFRVESSGMTSSY
jgi:hypothetical protein